MRRKFVLTFMMMFLLLPLDGQSVDGMEAVMELLDIDAEDLEEDEVERLCGLLKRPLRLNSASQSELMASGLFSRYQAASLTDYRNRSGSVMSFMELAAVDGFGEDFVDRIGPFVSLDPPDAGSVGRVVNEVLVRTALKASSEESRWAYDARYAVRAGDRLSAAISISRSLDASRPYPDILGGHLEWKFGRHGAKVIAGDFNARFGQGLAVWNGMNMGSFNSPSSFLKRSSGLTSSSSLTGKYAFTGLASELNAGRFTLSLMMAAPGIKQLRSKPDKVGLLPAANLTCNFQSGQVGLTHYAEFGGLASDLHIPAMMTSADAAFCVRGTDLFSEVAYDWVSGSAAARAGTVFPVGELVDAAAMLRASKEEYALSVSGSLLAGHWMQVRGTGTSRRRVDGTLSADMVLYPEPKSDTQDRSLQLKLRSQWRIVLSESFVLDFRLTERIRSWGQIFRTDLRTDLGWNSDRFSATLRMNVLKCQGLGFLTYAEGGFRSGKTTLHLRQGLFLIDDWDDRIYAYERDVPGAFNVPAYYGRGVWTSAMLAWRPVRRMKFHFRAGYVSYPFMKEKKPGRAELRLQSVFDF